MTAGAAAAARDTMGEQIGSKTREFFEFVLPPVDMRLDRDSLVLLADMPGFEKGDIRVALEGDILSIRASKRRAAGAERGAAAGGDGGAGNSNSADCICNQRPNRIDKKIRLPVGLAVGGGGGNAKGPHWSAAYRDGILRVTIPVRTRQRQQEPAA